MKKTLCAAFVLVMLAEQAMAAWTDKFTEDFKDLGMYDAVKNALSADVKPHDILAFVKKNPDMFETELSMKALYCAGEDVDAVQEAASQLGITEVEIGKALAESKKECGSMTALTDRDIVEPPNHGNLSGTPPQPQGGAPADSGIPSAPPAADGNSSGSSSSSRENNSTAAAPPLPPPPPFDIIEIPNSGGSGSNPSPSTL